MYDAIGTAGMLRGWVAVWTEQMLWPLAALAVALGALMIIETLIDARTRRTREKPRLVPTAVQHNYQSAAEYLPELENGHAARHP
jgi:hypothetical protein